MPNEVKERDNDLSYTLHIHITRNIISYQQQYKTYSQCTSTTVLKIPILHVIWQYSMQMKRQRQVSLSHRGERSLVASLSQPTWMMDQTIATRLGRQPCANPAK
jgi:hypothetical protein